MPSRNCCQFRQIGLGTCQHQVVAGARDPHEALRLRGELEQALAMPERQPIATPTSRSSVARGRLRVSWVGCTAKP